MRLTDLAEFNVSQMVWRLARRAIGFALVGLLAIVVVYHVSAAGTLALSLEFGPLYAYLIMAAIYAAVAAAVLIVLYATRTRPLPAQEKMANALSSPRNMQIAMLVEAVMLGYSLARKSGKSVS
jgi:hypothetical protein